MMHTKLANDGRSFEQLTHSLQSRKRRIGGENIAQNILERLAGQGEKKSCVLKPYKTINLVGQTDSPSDN